MARDIKVSWITFVPTWDGNDKDKDPISVEIRPLTYIAMNDVIASGQGKALNGQSDEHLLSERMFCKNVKNCKNLSVNGKNILTGEDIWGKAPFALTSEILNYLTQQSQLDIDEKKT